MTNMTILKFNEKVKTTLESWLATGSKEYPQTLEEALEQVTKITDIGIPKRYIGITAEEMDDCVEIASKERGSFIYGDCGTGKTRKLYAIAKILRANGQKVKVIDMLDFLDEVKATFSGNTYKSKDVLDSFTDYEVIMIDDMGVEKTTDWTLEIVYKLINILYLDIKKVYITSNLNLKSIETKYTDRVASRIAQMCEITQLTGDDKRLQ